MLSLLIAHFYSIRLLIRWQLKNFPLFRCGCRSIGKELARKQFLRQASINFWRGSHEFSNSNVSTVVSLCVRAVSIFFPFLCYFSVQFFFLFFFHYSPVLVPLLFFALIYSCTVSWAYTKWFSVIWREKNGNEEVERMKRRSRRRRIYVYKRMFAAFWC